MVEATKRRSDEATKGGRGWRAPRASRLTPHAFPRGSGGMGKLVCPCGRHAHPRNHGQASLAHATPRGFTLTELLVVVAIVVVLLGILIVAVNAAARTAQRASTQFLMTSIRQGLVRFKEDIGYYPPVLDRQRALFAPPVHVWGPSPSADDYPAQVQTWFSETTLAEYLIGYADRAEDGYGAVDLDDPSDSEKPRIGVRHPGPDGVWGATVYGDADGKLVTRNPANTGTVYGPYLELKDKHLLASTDGKTDSAGNLNVFAPGEGGYNPDDPKVLVDYWGRPIRYYRLPYPPRALHAAYRAVDRTGNGTIDPALTLADVIILRPYSFKPGTESDNPAVPDAGGDTSVVMSMRTAEFGLVSSGPDRALDVEHRVDENELNKDNIVEFGP